MINPTQDPNNLQRFYIQKKQRIDLYIDMSTQNVLGFTKLIFKPKSEIKDEIPEFLSLYLNCENMAINSVKLDKSQKVSDESMDQGGRDCGMKINGEKKIIIPLGYDIKIQQLMIIKNIWRNYMKISKTSNLSKI